MLSITDGGSLAHALSSSLNPHLKHLLRQRSDQLGGDITEKASFVIVQPGDTVEALEQELGFSVLQNPFDASRLGAPDFTPAFEWVVDHGFAYEAAFIFDDSGFAHVLVVENAPGVDQELIALCKAYTSEHSPAA